MLKSSLIALAASTILFAGAAVAQAASATIDQLPSVLAGVVGSGDKLGLALNEAGSRRVLQLGDTFGEGWVLSAITPDQASFSRNGQVRRIGLNPDGVAPQRAAPQQAATTVNVLSGEARGDQAWLQAARDEGLWDGAPFAGLDLAQTERLVTYSTKINDHALGMMSAAAAGQDPDDGTHGDPKAYLGEAGFQDYLDLQSTLYHAAKAGLGATNS